MGQVWETLTTVCKPNSSAAPKAAGTGSLTALQQIRTLPVDDVRAAGDLGRGVTLLLLSGPSGDHRTCDEDRAAVELPGNGVALLAFKRRRHRSGVCVLHGPNKLKIKLEGRDKSATGASLLL